MKISNVPKKRRHNGLIVFIILLVLTALLFLDSSYRIAVTEYEMFYDNLPQNFDGYRIVQLSDLHMAEFGKNNERLIRKVIGQEPDIVVLTGDFINMSEEKREGVQTAAIKPFLESISSIVPCYFISGNHEWASGEIKSLTETLKELNIIYLHNEFVFLEREGERIILAGVEDPNGPADMIKPDQLAEDMHQNYPDEFKILLGHRNDWIQKYPDLPVDLILCGHSHGGVVRLPFAGGVFGTGMDFFPKYDAGLFNEGNYDMIISRGLGGSTPMPRFLNNPEIVTVVLRRS